jgi:chemotaxis protein histidine kinase CheA
MSSSVGLLDFFVLEASDYVERLDGLLAQAGPRGPDGDAFARQARALRGSATMARLTTLAELATSIERAARALRDGQLEWGDALRGVLVSAVDDLKILIRGVRNWGPGEEQRVQTRLTELTKWVPASRTPALTPTTAQGGVTFLVGETAEIAASLEAFVAKPGDRTLLGEVLARVRALRGLATIKDVPPLADVMDGIERAAKPMELGREASKEQQDVLAAAAGVLRRATTSLRSGGRPDPNTPEVRRFADAVAKADERLADADRIVPIAELFHDDQGPHLVERAPHPPTSPGERFRLEVVSQAEHLRRLVADARAAADPAARERLGRELRAALRALRRAAESFGEMDVASFIAASADAASTLDARALDALDEAAVLLADPATRGDALARRLTELARGSVSVPPAAPASATPPVERPAATTPVAPEPLRPTTSSPTPTGRELHALLQSSISGLNRLDSQPLSQPVPIIEDTIVPIETLLYDGTGALARAREVREELRRRGGEPDRELLDELYDLLDLVTAE